MRPDTGELVKGQEVVVVRSPNDSRGRAPEDRYVRAVIVKAARVWVELEKVSDTPLPAWSINRWRMRRDTQDEGSQYSGSNASFRTLAQHEWHQREDEAWRFLREQGLTIQDSWSPWRGREAELADLIRQGQMRDEAGRENWARDQVRQAGKDWTTHMAKFDGTVLAR